MAQNREQSNQAPKVPRSKWVLFLHRKPTRWDVLFHKLAEAIVRRYWFTQAHFTQPTLKLDGDELWDISMQMSRAFAKQTSLAAVAHLTGPKQLSIFDLTSDTLAAISLEARSAAMKALLNYIEIAHNCFLARNHPDLMLLRPKIEETIERFLKDKCLPGGELHPCIENPLADDEGYFPPSPSAEVPADPQTSSGNARLDAYRLNILVHDEDDANIIKAKLLAFARTDPFIGPEFVVDLVTKLAGAELHAQQAGQKLNQPMETIRLRDRFLFTPCRQRGLSPVELFLEQQLMASERQKARLRRWADENVEGIFKVLSLDQGTVLLQDLGSGRQATIIGEDPAKFALKPGDVIRTRIVPWDDLWRFSGVQQVMQLSGSDAEEALKRQLHPLRLHRKLDNDDPRLAAAGKRTAFVHDQFVAHFGHEIARFADLAQCREKLAEFHHDLLVNTKLSDGRQFADAWREDVGIEFPPYFQDRFAAADPDTSSPAVIYDEVEGMGFIGNFEDVTQAMTAPTPTPKQVDAIRQLLLQSWKPGWLVRKVLLDRPQRGEELLREILGGESFSLDRNLEPLLGRLKAPTHTLPHRPVPFLVD